MRGAVFVVLMSAWLAPLAGCAPRTVDLKTDLQVTEITTGWFDAGIVGGKNKLVPTISLKLKNNSRGRISSVQLNTVFRRVGEQEEWGSAFTRGIGGEGLAAGASSPAIVLRSTLGYTGEQPRGQMLTHSEFRDAHVEVFAKHGPDQWVRLGDFPVKRQLLMQ
ncbi:MAG: hypothetical protein HYX76_05875 [Acidobacteria bacterium]|nr:hypothetical protein [Acidobacteriota bacterium]